MFKACTCSGCRRAKRSGRILGSRLLKHLGTGAHFVSDYVPYRRYRAGRRPDATASRQVIEA